MKTWTLLLPHLENFQPKSGQYPGPNQNFQPRVKTSQSHLENFQPRVKTSQSHLEKSGQSCHSSSKNLDTVIISISSRKFSTKIWTGLSPSEIFQPEWRHLNLISKISNRKSEQCPSPSEIFDQRCRHLDLVSKKSGQSCRLISEIFDRSWTMCPVLVENFQPEI